MTIETANSTLAPHDHEMNYLHPVIELVQREGGSIYVTQGEEGSHIVGCLRTGAITNRRFGPITILPESV